MIRRYPPNRMLSILVVLLAMTAYFSYDLYIRGNELSKQQTRIKENTVPENINNKVIMPKIIPPQTSNTEVQGGRPEIDMIRPGASLIIEKKYSKCGHIVSTKTPIPIDMVNLTEEQLKMAYKNWSIKKFSPEEIVITKTIPGKCRNHFIVKEKDGFVAVYYQQAIDGISLKEVTPLLTKNLPQKEKERLKEGIKIESQQELAQTLEDLGN